MHQASRLQPRGQALGAGLFDATGAACHSGGASARRRRRRGIFEPWTSVARSAAGSHERAKPQSLNEDSPRDERFSQFSLLAHVAAPLLASLRELVRAGRTTQPVSECHCPSLLQTHLRCSDQACPEEQLFASQACVHPRAGCDFRSTETDRGRRRVLTAHMPDCPGTPGQLNSPGLLIRRPIVGRISEARVPSCLGQQRSQLQTILL
jgi:hypothetical protein